MIIVYGDIMLDRWIVGNADRISPEAPVPVLLEESQHFSIGGAGNLALNIQSINGQVKLFGSVGQDKEGYKLLELLEDTDLEARVVKDHLVTTTKTRLVGQNGQHIVRWDNEEVYKGTEAYERLLIDATSNTLICVSDYNKGIVQENTVQELVSKGCKVLVDPKQSPEIYAGAFLVKPNMKEYISWFGEFTIESALESMRKHKWNWLVVTDGANGIHVLNEQGQYKSFKEPVKEVADVTGAGDTVLSVIAYGIERGLDIFESCKLACFAAARIVEKRGVAVITPKDLSTGIVFTNGVFDILHVGHLKLLKHAKTLGSKLVVGINSDTSVKRIKGDTRPINDEFTRKQALEELGFIDEVVIFDEDTPLQTMEKVQPDIIVKGGDYIPETVVGNHLAEVVIFPTVEGHSTTNIIGKMTQ